MKNVFNFVSILIIAALALLASIPKAYIRRAVEVKLFSPAARPTAAAMSAPGANNVKDATITVAQVGTTDDFTIAIQLLGENGIDLNGVGVVGFYFSTDSAGQVLAVNSTDIVSLAIGTDGLIREDSANVSGFLTSESDGDIDLAIEVADNKVVYLCLVMPDGRLVISTLLSYTA